ncbi:MAG: DNA-processing protein DprA [Omnitrophica bacterium]|nr:DNA-processing protein DprA [Candidatus Omnitrophota bacterium]
MKILSNENKFKTLRITDKDYPANLKHIYDPPATVYLKGELILEDNIAIAIVGSRRATPYGLKNAKSLAFELAARGITVVSGLARGIDSAAHRGALEAKGRTIAVLGSGLNVIYPHENERLAEEIAKSGAVISEFQQDVGPQRYHFPRRNRIISGLSLGVVVVEAAQKSGALITANCALEQGREVFALPGKIDSWTSRGTHDLIKQGAKLVESIEDIIEELEPLNLQKKG